jgi:CopG family nickel-responsive transcriptional regulator
MPIVSMSLQEELLRRFDAAYAGRGFASRSEAMREALRDFVDEAEWEGVGGRNTLILVVVRDKSLPGADVIRVQHRPEEIQTLVHTHLDEVNCLEILVVRGESTRLKNLIKEVRKLRGVKQLKFITTTYNV